MKGHEHARKTQEPRALSRTQEEVRWSPETPLHPGVQPLLAQLLPSWGQVGGVSRHQASRQRREHLPWSAGGSWRHLLLGAFRAAPQKWVWGDGSFAVGNPAIRKLKFWVPSLCWPPATPGYRTLGSLVHFEGFRRSLLPTKRICDVPGAQGQWVVAQACGCQASTPWLCRQRPKQHSEEVGAADGGHCKGQQEDKGL